MQEIRIERTTAPKAKPQDESKLGFGKIFTDHMYVMEYSPAKGWHDPQILPYQPISLDPSAMVFHYGQEMFEGMKPVTTPSAATAVYPETPSAVISSPRRNASSRGSSCRRCRTLRHCAAFAAINIPCAGSMRFFRSSPSSTPARRTPRPESAGSSAGNSRIRSRTRARCSGGASSKISL